MGCGCGKKRTVANPPTSTARGAVVTPVNQTQVVYDVVVAGQVVSTSSSAAFARAEARRTGGTTQPRRVTPAEA